MHATVSCYLVCFRDLVVVDTNLKVILKPFLVKLPYLVNILGKRRENVLCHLGHMDVLSNLSFLPVCSYGSID